MSHLMSLPSISQPEWQFLRLSTHGLLTIGMINHIITIYFSIKSIENKEWMKIETLQ